MKRLRSYNAVVTRDVSANLHGGGGFVILRRGRVFDSLEVMDDMLLLYATCDEREVPLVLRNYDGIPITTVENLSDWDRLDMGFEVSR